MDFLYRYLNDIAHNRRKLHLIAGVLLLCLGAAWLALSFEWTASFLKNLDLLEPAKNLRVSLGLLLALTLYLDFKARSHSISKATMGKAKLQKKYARDASRLLVLNGISLCSTKYYVYEKPIDVRDLSIRVEDGGFQISWYIEQYCNELIRRFSPAKTFNGLTLRFEGFADNDSRCFRLKYATYYDYLVTNGSHDSKLFNELTVRDILEPGPGLNPLEASQCANHLGLSSLIFTSDNYLLLQQRSKNVSAFAGMLSPSVSGAANYSTFDDGTGKLSFATWFETEIREELTDKLSLQDFEEIKALGLSRELIRLGKPELFFVARLKISRNELEELLKSQQKELLVAGGSILGTALNSPAAISRNESEKFVWLKYGADDSLADKLAKHKIEQVKDETELRFTIDDNTYLMSESLAANFAFLCSLGSN